MPRSQAETASRYCESTFKYENQQNSNCWASLAIAYFVHADNASVLEPFTDGM